MLTVRAMKAASVRLDGRVVLAFREGAGPWKAPRRVDLSPYLAPGNHQVEVAVTNRNGPAMLLVYSEDLGLATGAGWEAVSDPSGWRRVLTAEETPPVRMVLRPKHDPSREPIHR